MSLKTMPILFLNMGGEMVYILEQRLKAQTVRQDKANRVMGDIIGTMFTKKFIDELFKPQPLYSRKGMRALFEKLAHASIMRLNTTSMDKLYDLMTMACKYQFQSAICPRHVLLITLNHMDSVRKIVQGQSNLQNLIDHAYSLLHKHFFSMTTYELAILRCTLLCFYQDARIKVSLLLREMKQKEDGRFYIDTQSGETPVGIVPPGTIRYFSASGARSGSKMFDSGGKYRESTSEGSLTKTVKPGERVTTLGTNMYTEEAVRSGPGAVPTTGDRVASSGSGGGNGSAGRSKRANSKGRAGAQAASTGSADSQHDVAGELKLLTQLLTGPIIHESEVDTKKGFTLTLFDDDDDERQYAAGPQGGAGAAENVVKIDASKRDRRHINKAMADLSVDDDKKTKKRKPKGEELLDMMDSVADET